MTESIPIERLNRYRGHFPGLHLELVLDSIAAGNTEGQLWDVAQPGGEPILLLWDRGNNVLYLAGECRVEASVQRLASLVHDDIRPQALVAGAAYFKTRALSASLEQELPRIFAGIALRDYPTLFHTYESASPPAVARPALRDLAVVPIDRALLTREDLANREQVRAEIRWMWPSEDRFYREGFGAVALLQDQIICWCTAEYVGPTRCGVGITTIPAYERRGVATATAASFVAAALERGLTPCWECGRANAGSIRVAEKVGFVRQAEERSWAGQMDAAAGLDAR